jgi:hypothetical protein
MDIEFDVHVCLISAQLAPNLLPLLDKTLAPKQKSVIMVVTKEMKNNADALTNVIKKYGIKEIERVQIDDQYDYENIQSAIDKCISKYDKNLQLVLNLTGGTKIMTIASLLVFSLHSRPIFYLKETDNTAIIIEGMEGNVIGSIHLENELKVEDYLLAYQYITPKSVTVLPHRPPLPPTPTIF